MAIGIILLEYGITEIGDDNLCFREFEFFIKKKIEFLISIFKRNQNF